MTAEEKTLNTFGGWKLDAWAVTDSQLQKAETLVMVGEAYKKMNWIYPTDLFLLCPTRSLLSPYLSLPLQKTKE